MSPQRMVKDFEPLLMFLLVKLLCKGENNLINSCNPACWIGLKIHNTMKILNFLRQLIPRIFEKFFLNLLVA